MEKQCLVRQLTFALPDTSSIFQYPGLERSPMGSKASLPSGFLFRPIGDQQMGGESEYLFCQAPSFQVVCDLYHRSQFLSGYLSALMILQNCLVSQKQDGYTTAGFGDVINYCQIQNNILQGCKVSDVSFLNSSSVCSHYFTSSFPHLFNLYCEV